MVACLAVWGPTLINYKLLLIIVFNRFLVCFFTNASQCCSVILMIFFDHHYVSVDSIVWSVLLQIFLSLDLYIFFLFLCIILLFIIHHSVKDHCWLYSYLILFMSSIHHFGLPRKILNALQRLFILRCDVLSLGFCLLINMVCLLYVVKSCVVASVLYFLSLCFLWPARFIMSLQTWYSCQFVAVLCYILVFVYYGKSTSLNWV